MFCGLTTVAFVGECGPTVPNSIIQLTNIPGSKPSFCRRINSSFSPDFCSRRQNAYSSELVSVAIKWRFELEYISCKNHIRDRGFIARNQPLVLVAILIDVLISRAFSHQLPSDHKRWFWRR